MQMSNQVTAGYQSVNFKLRNLSRIRMYMYIDKPSRHAATRAVVTSRLDYANSLLFGISSADCKRLQLLQNRATKLIYQAQKIWQCHFYPWRSSWADSLQPIKLQNTDPGLQMSQYWHCNFILQTELIQLYKPARKPPVICRYQITRHAQNPHCHWRQKLPRCCPKTLEQ